MRLDIVYKCFKLGEISRGGNSFRSFFQRDDRLSAKGDGLVFSKAVNSEVAGSLKKSIFWWADRAAAFIGGLCIAGARGPWHGL